MSSMKKKCYDCGEETTDFVTEMRHESASMQGSFAPEHWSHEVTIHANRRECAAARIDAKLREKRQRDPFYDVPAC